MAYKIPYLPCKKRTAACIFLWWKVPAVFLLPDRPVPCIGSVPEVLSPAVTFNLYLHTMFHFLLHMCFSYFYIYILFRKKCKYPCIKRSEKEGKMHPSYPQLHFCFLFYLLQIGNLAVKLL